MGMSYGHAERNLVLLRQLEAETRQLLESLDRPDPEQWVCQPDRQEASSREEMTDKAPIVRQADVSQL